MNDLISRQAVLDMANGWTYNFCDPEDEWAAMKEIRELPSAEPEIIRCKDCKHYKIDHPRANGYHCCYRMHNIFPMKPDDFCSHAERREDGTP